MAYVSVADWKPEQVTEWLKGLDAVILPYIHSFVNNEVNGQQLLSLRPDDLQHRGISKVGHQEIILEAIEYLRNFQYELHSENIQLLALRLSCQAHSLYRVLTVEEEENSMNLAGNTSKVQSVTTQTLADVAGVIACIKPLALWLDRPPFFGLPIYQELRTNLLSHGLNIATCAQRDRFAERPVDEIRQHCQQLATLADKVIQDYTDPLILQPASLELATIKKRAGDDVGFYLSPSLSGTYQIVEVKLQGAAHQSGKVEEGDEIVQVNYQTVVGWRFKAVWELIQETSTQLFLTLKKRPRHSSVYGQIYIKPYRLPSRKRNPTLMRWNIENLPSPRPELLTIPQIELPLPTIRHENNLVAHPAPPSCISDADTSDEDDSAFLPFAEEVVEGDTSSPSSVRLILPRTRAAVQRRATVSGASPTAKHPSPGLEQLWAEMQQRKGLSPPKTREEPAELRGKSGSAMQLAIRPNTVLGSESSESGGLLSPMSPVPAVIRTKLHQTSSNPLQQSKYPNNQAYSEANSPIVKHQSTAHVTAVTGNLPSQTSTSYFKPLPQVSHYPVNSSYSPPQFQRSSGAYIVPSHQAPGPSQTQIMSPPAHQAPKLSDLTQSVSSSSNIKSQDPVLVTAPSPSTQGSFQFLDILPTSASYGHTSINQTPAIVIESDGMGDTLHERAVDCSPVPPPRPASSLRSATTMPSTRGPVVNVPQPASRSLMARTVSRTKQKLSPRADRKKNNNLLNKRRNVSCKQLGVSECDGWLLQRARAAAGGSWSRAWFILKDTALYGFSNPDAKKADKLISLPGFTAAAAPEVKSRQFAFKVYHMGTAFYFAAGCVEELNRWLGCLATATLGVRANTSAPYFSETEDEEQPARPPTRAASSGNVSGDQNSKGEDRRFGSLRKLAGSWRTDEGATSLDRKYLPRILRQEVAVPIPTDKFRSYRRDRSGIKENSGFDPTHTRTLPCRLGSQQQQRVMSVDSVANPGSTNSLPNTQFQGLSREGVGSSPHLPTVHEPANQAEKTPRRILGLFSPSLSRKFGGSNKTSENSNSLSPGPTSPPTILGSPKLHRALFRGRRQSPQSNKAASLQPRRIPPTLPEDSPPPVPVVNHDSVVPDYPGLEYPPVFEPGTYTLNPEAREQFRSSNTCHPRTNRTLMLLPKPKDACWPTQSMNLTSHPLPVETAQRRIRLTSSDTSRRLPPQPEETSQMPPAEGQGLLRRNVTNQQEDVVLISSLDLISSTDV